MQVLSHYAKSGYVTMDRIEIFGEKPVETLFTEHVVRKAFSADSNKPYQHMGRLDCLFRLVN